METTTVRLLKDTHLELRQIALKEGTSIQTVLENMVTEYRRRTMLEEGNRAYAALQRDSAAWKEEMAERKLWENTLADGLEDDA